jgi:hypothetical protein
MVALPEALKIRTKKIERIVEHANLDRREVEIT